jgi:hypothetical protein
MVPGLGMTDGPDQAVMIMGLNCDFLEPPIGIEPMTYSLREARVTAPGPPPAPIAPRPARKTRYALRTGMQSFHDPFHARRRLDARCHLALNEANSEGLLPRDIAVRGGGRSVVIQTARIRQDTIRALRDPGTGYGTIAQRLSLTKSRVQQIANTPARQIVAAYAFRDELGAWHGQARLLAQGRYQESPTFIPFDPADKYNPLAGQALTVRYGEIADDEAVSVEPCKSGWPTAGHSTCA